jgi:hypothetical protein
MARTGARMIFSPGCTERGAASRRSHLRKVPYSLLSVEIRPEEHPEQGQDEQVGRPAAGYLEGSGRRARRFITGGAYSLLFLFAAAQGLIGCFQFSRGVGPVPLAALGFCILILATCVLGAAAMDSPAGALLPAVGWFLVTVLLTLPTAQGSVIVTNTVAGEWYLYGGSACAAAGTLIAFTRRFRDLAGGRPAAAGRGLAAASAPPSGQARGQSPRGAGL